MMNDREFKKTAVCQEKTLDKPHNLMYDYKVELRSAGPGSAFDMC